MRPHLIVNPASGGGRTGRAFDRLAPLVREAVGEFDCSFTRGPGDAAALARDAARAGAGLVVAVGGDGTASEVVDGLLDGGGPRGVPRFGLVPHGTGGDFRRSLGSPADPERAVRALGAASARAGPGWTIDLGRVEFVGHDGTAQARHFANVASAGISGRVVQQVERMGKALGGRATFLLGAARSLVGWRDQPVRWRADGGPWHEEALTAIAVCNGSFFGGGMMVAPGARLDDGELDVTLWRGIGLADFVLRRRMLYDGTHVRLANTRTLRARVVEAEPLGDETVLLDVDGEQPGRLPARFTVVPGALRVAAAPTAPGDAAAASGAARAG
jgi:YegS/Rv2252/BmrU family lipid kinase